MEDLALLPEPVPCRPPSPRIQSGLISGACAWALGLQERAWGSSQGSPSLKSAWQWELGDLLGEAMGESGARASRERPDSLLGYREQEVAQALPTEGQPAGRDPQGLRLAAQTRSNCRRQSPGAGAWKLGNRRSLSPGDTRGFPRFRPLCGQNPPAVERRAGWSQAGDQTRPSRARETLPGTPPSTALIAAFLPGARTSSLPQPCSLLRLQGALQPSPWEIPWSCPLAASQSGQISRGGSRLEGAASFVSVQPSVPEEEAGWPLPDALPPWAQGEVCVRHAGRATCRVAGSVPRVPLCLCV